MTDFLRSALCIVGARCLKPVLGYPCARRRWHSGSCEVSAADAPKLMREIDEAMPYHVASGKTHAAAVELSRTTGMSYTEAYDKLREAQKQWEPIRRSLRGSGGVP